MSIILNIETATNICSVAISSNNTIIFEKENTTGPFHASLLGVFVSEALAYTRSNEISIDAVAVSCGPGSYTGLRIGVAEAKGLCYGLDIPMIAINTPEVMVNSVINNNSIDDETLLCPMIDARRMEVYAAIYNNKIEEVRDIRADIVDEQTYMEYLNKHKVIFFGNGSDKCQPIITHTNAHFLPDIYPSAKYMASLSAKAFANSSFVDIAYFEPFYLKDFIATTPKKNIL